jgi:hypothetical protein
MSQKMIILKENNSGGNLRNREEELKLKQSMKREG